MVNDKSFGSTVIQMRLEEERAYRAEMQLAQRELESARIRIGQLEEQADALHYAAIVAHSEGQAEQARSYRRQRRQAVIARARQISELAAAKMRFGQARQQLHQVIQQRDELSVAALRNATPNVLNP